MISMSLTLGCYGWNGAVTNQERELSMMHNPLDLNRDRAYAGPSWPNSMELPHIQYRRANCGSGTRVDSTKAQQTRKKSGWEMLSIEEAITALEVKAEPPSVENLIYVVQKCRKTKNLAYAKRVHMLICCNWSEFHEALGNYLVPMFVECGSMSDAKQVFDMLVRANEYSWTSLIQGYADCGDLQYSLSLYQKMQRNHVHPSRFTFMPLLKACARLKNIERGREIHADIAKGGYETDAVVGSSLVDMYAKCGSLAEAQEVLCELPLQNAVSWNALIGRYAELVLGEEALDCLELMQSQGISPDAVTFICSLKACGSIRAMEQGRQLHAEIVQEGHDEESFAGNTIVDMYAKCDSLAEAQVVFDKLQMRDVITWNALISEYAEHGLGEEAIHLFHHMQIEGVLPDAVTFVSILKACGTIRAAKQGQEIHIKAIKERVERDRSVGNSLVHLYGKCGLLTEAQEVFDQLPVQDVVSWTALMQGYTEHGFDEEALNCFIQMQLEGISPNPITFACILKACGCARTMDSAREIHAEVVKRGYEMYNFVNSNLVNTYVKFGTLAEAEELLDKLNVKDVTSWNAVIAGYAERGLGEKVANCLTRMEKRGVSPNAATFACSSRACGSLGAISRGYELHIKIVREGLDKDPFMCSNLVGMYAKCGSLIEAQILFENLLIQDLISWTALATGYAEQGLAEEVLNCLDEMQVEGVLLDAFMITRSLKACSSTGNLDRGRAIHAEIAREGFTGLYVGNTLVDLYVKCFAIAEAQEVFNMLPVQDVVSWTALITGYAEQGLDEDVFRCFKQMQVEGVSLDAVAFVGCLKACGTIISIKMGQELHIEIVKQGLENDGFVGSALLDMYGRCGSLAEAHEVFHKLQVKDVVTWTVLITGYANHGFYVEALNCFEEVQQEGILPDAGMFVCALQACCMVGSIDRGQAMHIEIVRAGFERDHFVSNILLDMYLECGLFAEAQELFDMLRIHDLESWNTIISGYAEFGLIEEAMNCFQQMQLHHHVSTDAFTYVCCLKACGSTGGMERGREIHAEAVKQGLDVDRFVSNTLVDVYGKCGSPAEAHELFYRLPQDVVLWTALIAGYAENALGDEALSCFEQSKLNDVPVDAVTFVCALKGCGSLGVVDAGQDIHTEIVMQGFDKDPSVASSLVDMYVKCGSIAESQDVFDKFTVQDVGLFSALIAGYAEHGLGHKVLEFLEQMKLESIIMDAVTFVCALKACGSMEGVDTVQKLHAEIVKEGFDSDYFVGRTLIDMYAEFGFLAEAQEIFHKLPTQDVVTWTALLSGYAGQGFAEEALKIFQQMQLEGTSPDVVSWNAMISSYAEQEDSEKALMLYLEMQEKGHVPNDGTFVCTLKACGSTGALETGKAIFAEVYKVHRSDPHEIILATAIIDMYGKCGKIIESQQLFDMMPIKHLATWNALIAGYSRLGESQFVFQLLNRMEEEGMQPDGITFLGVLAVCSHVGLVNEGQRYFKAMNDEYGISQTVKHQNCMIDLLGRAGQLDAVVAILEEMHFEADLVTWSTVLVACKKWGNLELSRLAFEFVVRLDEKLSAPFILLSSIYMHSCL